jgi:uncharacterized membrane protein
MAGIGFALKRMFEKDTYTNRALAYLYSSFIAAGPWILSVISINFLLVLMKLANIETEERNLFSATIVYSFLFSQVLIAPVQLTVTRYISDKLYNQEYARIRPTFLGLNKIMFFLSITVCFVFYFNKPLPIYYKLFASYLFIIISLIWVLMIFLSAVKNYKLIAKAYFFGGALTLGLIFYFLENPIQFKELQGASIFLLSYVIGLSLILVLFLYNFFSTFFYGDKYQYDFFKYLGKFASLGLIGFFYTSGLWTDNIILWFGDFQETIMGTYTFAPYYDNAVFLSYLTTIPTLVLFLVIIETDFFKAYKQYFENANSAETFEEIDKAKDKMKDSLNYNLIYTFIFQFLITLTLILTAKPIFKYFNINYFIRDLFRITSFGAMFNIFAFILILVLLYFERRGRALITAVSFFVLNASLTLYFTTKPLKYTGFGFVIASIITFILAVIFLKNYLNQIHYSTFALQPLYLKDNNDIFVRLANNLNARSDLDIDKMIEEKEI